MEAETSGWDELAAALKRCEADYAAIGSGDDDASNEKRGRLMIESALYFGYIALVTMPGAKNYIVGELVFDGAEDPQHAAIALEVRWRAGKRPSERLNEAEAETRRVEDEWREMKRERDEARQTVARQAEEIATLRAILAAVPPPEEE